MPTCVYRCETKEAVPKNCGTASLSVKIVDLLLIIQWICNKRSAIQLFFMHIDCGDLAVIVCRVVVDASIGVATAGVYGFFKPVGCTAAALLLSNG